MTKPANFPARKLQRRFEAAHRWAKGKMDPLTPQEQAPILAARAVRTKKMRGERRARS